MDGIHDLGGMEGFGPVLVEPDEPPFHDRWEGRVHGMMLTLAAGGHIRNFRHAIERMDPVHYLTSTYYEHWLDAIERILVEREAVSVAELRDACPSSQERQDAELAARVVSLLKPSSVPAGAVEAGLWREGARVRVRRTWHAAHTRCPRYVRGASGVVRRVHPASALPDALIDGNVQREPYYSVAFPAAELWGEGADPRVEVVIDLWQSYLEDIGE